MIGSPSGIDHERDLVEHEISNWNRENVKGKGTVFIAHRWETSPTPVVGEGSAQDRIDEVLDECQVLIALLADRIGRPHSGYAGATEYEIERALSNGTRVHIIRLNPNRPIGDVDPEQLKGVRAFMERMMSRGLLVEVNTNAALQDVVRRVLSNDASFFARNAQESVVGAGMANVKVALDTSPVNSDSILITNEGDKALDSFDLDTVTVDGRPTTVLNSGALYRFEPGQTLRYPLTTLLPPESGVVLRLNWRQEGMANSVSVTLKAAPDN